MIDKTMTQIYQHFNIQACAYSKKLNQIPHTCYGCRYFYGEEHNEDFVVCGFYRQGKENCPKFKCLNSNKSRRNKLMLHHLKIQVLHKFNYYISARNKDQKLVGCFFENSLFYRLLIAIPSKIYRKFGWLNQILVGQMLKLVRKWLLADCYF